MQRACFRLKPYNNYLLRSEVIYVTMCTNIEAKTGCTVVKVIARIVIDVK